MTASEEKASNVFNWVFHRIFNSLAGANSESDSEYYLDTLPELDQIPKPTSIHPCSPCAEP